MIEWFLAIVICLVLLAGTIICVAFMVMAVVKLVQFIRWIL